MVKDETVASRGQHRATGMYALGIEWPDLGGKKPETVRNTVPNVAGERSTPAIRQHQELVAGHQFEPIDGGREEVENLSVDHAAGVEFASALPNLRSAALDGQSPTSRGLRPTTGLGSVTTLHPRPFGERAPARAQGEWRTTPRQRSVLSTRWVAVGGEGERVIG